MTAIDVIVPCYKYGHFLRECVESVLVEKRIQVRVLVIDDASPDNTREVAEGLVMEDARVTYVRHTTNKGHIATYNEGIDWVAAKYMLLLSADDYVLPGALFRAVCLMERFPEVGFTYGKAIEFLDSGDHGVRPATPDLTTDCNWRVLPGREFIESCGVRTPVRTPTAVVRSALQKFLGGYRPDLPHSGDMEMWLRFAAHGSVGVLEEYQAVYRRHRANMSLSYNAKRYWGDLLQRREALEYFLSHYAGRVGDVAAMRRWVNSALAVDAIGIASAAFNDQDAELLASASALAVTLNPRIGWTGPGLRLGVKRLIGSRLWTLMRPLVVRGSE